MQRPKFPRQLQALACGPLAAAAAATCVQRIFAGDSVPVIAAYGGLAYTSWLLWREAVDNGKRNPAQKPVMAQFASVATVGGLSLWERVRWGLGFGSSQTTPAAIRFRDKRKELLPDFTFETVPGVVELQGIVSEQTFYVFCRYTFQWWQNHAQTQDIKPNGKQRTINEVLARGRYLKLSSISLAPVELDDCFRILHAAGVLWWDNRKAARLQVVMLPSEMVAHCKTLWGECSRE